MATNFPGSLDAFTNPSSSDTLDNPPHDQQHADANDAIEALQAKVGVDGSAVTSSLDYQINNGYRYHSTLYFTSSGTFTKATYPWLRAVRVKVQGGGGAGGGATTDDRCGGSGGGGGYAEDFLLVGSLSASETVTVASGGTGSSGGSGTAGGTSSFGSHVVATGGSGGFNNANGSGGGYRGTGTAGSLIISGESGTNGSSFNRQTGGNGGNSHMGAGGLGGGENFAFTNSNGYAGENYGGGGGAGLRLTVNAAGGNGAAGIVIVELYA